MEGHLGERGARRCGRMAKEIKTRLANWEVLERGQVLWVLLLGLGKACRIIKTIENMDQDAHDGRGRVTRAYDCRARALTQAVFVVEWAIQRMKG